MEEVVYTKGNRSFIFMMRLFLYLLKRLCYALSVILGATFLVFIIFNVLVGDPTFILLGKYATPEAMVLLARELGLDKPWYIQYWEVLKSAFTFNFGYSWTTKQYILKIFQEGGLVSLTVTLPAFLIGNSLVISVALWMTQYRGTIWDRLLVTFCIVMTSISILVYILIGQLFFACKLRIFPIMGYEKGFLASMPYIILPTIILVLLHFCYHYRFYRTIMLEEMYQDYVRTARAKGLPEERVLFKHIFKNVMVPIVTTFVKDFPSLLFGYVVIENFFGIPGLGNVVIDAISLCDFPTIKAVTIIAAVLSVLCNIVGDVLYTLVDPRIKL
ncbi:Binding-protein-dependent transport system inner membrane component [Cardinium endosymbiont of Sogatella furcifera]|uniref:ABC transporter permease n=1 Tax=Cardinium endosymbiont of Sogatella furcifera TaxID=650378 RepID=UPI000E102470|nr:ABC transporter permease [Cardinium endosymbiont of Sogatella furcifera]AXI24574.1 Binding-protein-dependent transport system inner membrane component [Cardinium endosymbiont of Sogatella furcifera]